MGYDVMENWKSTGAFLIFIGVYVVTVGMGMPLGVVEVSGFIALYSSLFMMMRSDFSKEMLDKLISTIKISK